jgi:hypothetical protein
VRPFASEAAAAGGAPHEQEEQGDVRQVGEQDQAEVRRSAHPEEAVQGSRDRVSQDEEVPVRGREDGLPRPEVRDPVELAEVVRVEVVAEDRMENGRRCDHRSEDQERAGDVRRQRPRRTVRGWFVTVGGRHRGH